MLEPIAHPFTYELSLRFILDVLLRSLRQGSGAVYITPYLISKGLSIDQVDNQIYPISRYICFVLFMIFDLILDKIEPWIPLLVEQIIAAISFGPLLWGQTWWMMQIWQIFSGMSRSLMLYHHQMMTKILASKNKRRPGNEIFFAQLFGTVSGSLGAQMGLYMGWFGYQGLFIVNFIIAIIQAILFLPLKRLSSTASIAKDNPHKSENKGLLKKLPSFTSLMEKINSFYASKRIVLFSLLYFITFACHTIGESYYTSYAYEIMTINNSGYNMNGVIFIISTISYSLVLHGIYLFYDRIVASGQLIPLLASCIGLNAAVCFFLSQPIKNVLVTGILWMLYSVTGRGALDIIYRKLVRLAPLKKELNEFAIKSLKNGSLCFHALFQLIISNTRLGSSLSSRYFTLSMITLASLPIFVVLFLIESS